MERSYGRMVLLGITSAAFSAMEDFDEIRLELRGSAGRLAAVQLRLENIDLQFFGA